MLYERVAYRYSVFAEDDCIAVKALLTSLNIEENFDSLLGINAKTFVPKLLASLLLVSLEQDKVWIPFLSQTLPTVVAACACCESYYAGCPAFLTTTSFKDTDPIRYAEPNWLSLADMANVLNLRGGLSTTD